jgi:hypothetical protein
MKGPVYQLTANAGNIDQIGISQRNPGWCVAFVRFEEPAAMYDKTKEVGLQAKRMLVVENDCISVSITRPKNSFAKTATVTMKIGEIYYQDAVCPGDWVFIWMSDYANDITAIADELRAMGNGAKPKRSLNDWESGLKFVGRVHGVNAADSIAPGGGRDLTQTINCQAFLEFATSIYYTFITDFLTNPSGENSASDRGNTFVDNLLKRAIKNLSEKYIQAMENTLKESEHTPDRIISTLLILIMGVTRKENFWNIVSNSGAAATYNDAIGVPDAVATILGRSGKSKLWEMFNFYMGIQRYETKSILPWQQFTPVLAKIVKPGDIFLATPTRLRGQVPYLHSPRWDNVSLWTILSEFLDEIVNEMYTCLRINGQNQIVPSMVVREKPFGTNLFHELEKGVKKIKIEEKKKATVPDAEEPTKAEQKSTPVTKEDKKQKMLHDWVASDHKPSDEKSRTLYENLPRWVLHESLLLNINTSTSESARINFVQVWGRSKQLDMITGGTFTSEDIMKNQIEFGNHVVDVADIARNGLRANIAETQFDIYNGKDTTIGLSPLYAKMRADWLFNGHLKLSGSLTCLGIKAPICEGDNLEIRGMVYHIDSVSFSGSINGGRKTFTTSLSISNGILAESLTGARSKTGKPLLPAYAAHLDPTRDNQPGYVRLPGKTDVELLHTPPSRDINGESIKKVPKKGDA